MGLSAAFLDVNGKLTDIGCWYCAWEEAPGTASTTGTIPTTGNTPQKIEDIACALPK
jgi:hypothetical protein